MVPVLIRRHGAGSKKQKASHGEKVSASEMKEHATPKDREPKPSEADLRQPLCDGKPCKNESAKEQPESELLHRGRPPGGTQGKNGCVAVPVVFDKKKAMSGRVHLERQAMCSRDRAMSAGPNLDWQLLSYGLSSG